jgi:acetyl esterase
VSASSSEPVASWARRLSRLPRRLERDAAVHGERVLVAGASRTVRRLFALAGPAGGGIAIERDLPYLPDAGPEQRLDVYRPVDRPGPLPIVVYVHGGGFRIHSKDTHWHMATAFVRQGYLVFNVGYRLAPRHRYPAAARDVLDAYRWIVRNARGFGGDLDRIALAGDSAGANLVSALAIALSYPRPEAWAADLIDLEARPRAVIGYCGLYQVSDIGRLGRLTPMPGVVRRVVDTIADEYLGGAPAAGAELADPLLVLERGIAPTRPLPAWYLAVGTRDPVQDDTRRMAAALAALGAPCRAAYFEGERHAFQAVVVTPAARRCWGEAFGFLDQHARARG